MEDELQVGTIVFNSVVLPKLVGVMSVGGGRKKLPKLSSPKLCLTLDSSYDTGADPTPSVRRNAKNDQVLRKVPEDRCGNWDVG